MSLRNLRRSTFFSAAFLLLLFGIQAAAAQEDLAKPAPTPIKTEVPIPLVQKIEGYAGGKVDDLATYIGVIYQFAIAIIGVVAAVMMIVGGFQWLTSAGDSGKIGQAKKRITNALMGLVLTLSAYVLLNTINPALLQFKPLSGQLAAVKTELAFLPFCEDLRDPKDPNQPLSVEALATNVECGTIGRYELGKGPSYCIYRGVCGDTPAKISKDPLWTSCLRKAGVGQKEIEEMLSGKNPGVAVSGAGNDSKVAVCLPCVTITKSVASTLGYPNLDKACSTWMTDRDRQFLDRYTVGASYLPADQRYRFWSYCAAGDLERPSCIQADIDCQAVNKNGDDQTEGSGVGVITGNVAGGLSCGLTQSCGCEGYDDSPEPIWTDKDYTLDQVRTTGVHSSGDRKVNLDYYPKNLVQVCTWNPCENYAEAGQPAHFKNGCKGGNGVVWTVVRAVRKLNTSFNDCRNR